MVAPRVESEVGVVIPPLRLTDDVRDFMKRHKNKQTLKTLILPE